MAAAALPSFIGQTGKARELEFQNSVGVINRAQQAYHWEKGFFAQGATDEDTLTILNITFDNKYVDDYNLTASSSLATSSLVNNEYDFDQTRAYSGGIFYSSGTYEATVCRSILISSQILPPATFNNCLGHERLE